VIKHESNCLLDKRVKCFSLRLLSKSFHPEYGAWFDQLDSESNKSLKVLTKWNLLIKIYLMLKDSINISLRYDSKNDRKTKGSEALYSFNATSLYSSERRHKIKQDTFSLFEATTVDTWATTTREHHDSMRPWPAMTWKRPDACQKDRGCGLTCRAPISDFLRMRVQILKRHFALRCSHRASITPVISNFLFVRLF